MNRVLITGASGFIGRHVCRHLIDAGFSVHAAVRRPNPDAVLHRCEHVHVTGSMEHLRPGDWPLRGIDAVVHLAARVHRPAARSGPGRDKFRRVNVEATKSLFDACHRCGVHRFVFLSSIAAAALDRPPGSEPRSRRRAYAVSKYEAEQQLIERSARSPVETVLLRPPMVYGPQAPGNIDRLVRAIRAGALLPLGSLHHRRSLIYVENLTDAIVRCLVHPASRDGVFEVADDTPVTPRELALLIGRASGCRPRLVPVPPRLLRVAGRCCGRGDAIASLTTPLIADTAAIRNRLGWQPPFTTEQGIARSYGGAAQRVGGGDRAAQRAA